MAFRAGGAGAWGRTEGTKPAPSDPALEWFGLCAQHPGSCHVTPPPSFFLAETPGGGVPAPLRRREARRAAGGTRAGSSQVRSPWGPQGLGAREAAGRWASRLPGAAPGGRGPETPGLSFPGWAAVRGRGGRRGAGSARDLAGVGEPEEPSGCWGRGPRCRPPGTRPRRPGAVPMPGAFRPETPPARPLRPPLKLSRGRGRGSRGIGDLAVRLRIRPPPRRGARPSSAPKWPGPELGVGVGVSLLLSLGPSLDLASLFQSGGGA